MAGMGDAKHLETGSKRPGPPGKDVLRVYGMKFCPYVQRLKLVIAAKDVKHETININLVRKPEWYFEVNPGGKVPSLEINGEIVYESDITARYVNEVYPGRDLETKDPLRKAKEQMVLGHFGTAVQGFYKSAYATDEESKVAALTTLNSGLGKLEAYFKTTGFKFICKDQVGFTDYMVWPHLERMLVFNNEVLSSYPLITEYCSRMAKDVAVVKCRHSDGLHRRFVQGYREKNHQYDIFEE